MGNHTDQHQFYLTGLSNNMQLQILFFLLFLIIYLLTLLGNSLIMLAIRTNCHLQNPMYFFLSHLSFLDLCFSSATVPEMLKTIIAKQKTISIGGCFIQAFLIMMLATTEVFILSSMAYDRYSAICKPLHYIEIMNATFCQKLVATAWMVGFFYAVANILPLLALQFCGTHVIKHFSCELPSILSLSCSDTYANKILFFISGSAVGLVSLFLTILSYIHITATVLKITSTEGRHKAFSTCTSHLIVVILFYGAGYFRYLRPASISSVVLDEIFSIQYCVFTSFLNPIIYSLQNKEVKAASKKLLKEAFKKLFHQKS
nr:olfactory receptor 5A2-like [Anolis sagrei ordinatus]